MIAAGDEGVRARAVLQGAQGIAILPLVQGVAWEEMGMMGDVEGDE